MKQKLPRYVTAFLSSAFQAFGMYNIHAVADVTEGGVLGLTLLLEQWFAISPALSGLILNGICYFLGWRTFGKEFIYLSMVAAGGFSVGYGICECFPPLWPEIANMPLLAALLGALFIGIGCGIFALFGKFDAFENIDGDTLFLVGILALVVVTTVVCKIIQFFKKK